MGIRLEKYLANHGVASRREAKKFVIDGRVKINGKTVFIPGRHIDPKKDLIEFDGRKIDRAPKKIYLMLNKPSGYICSVHADGDRPSVMDLIKGVSGRVFPVGRLDLDTEGLLLFTNDGDLSHKILRPENEIWKTYLVWVKDQPTKKSIDRLRKGIYIFDRDRESAYRTQPAKIFKLQKRGGNTLFKVIIHEGKKRQIRRMFAVIGHEVIYLKRIRIGELSLDRLPIGKFRHLKPHEVEMFC